MTQATQESPSASPLTDFAKGVFEGLSRPAKSLPCRFFYDAAGSALFEEITRQPEYYLTGAEATILEAHAREMLGEPKAGMVLVEFGSGSSLKTEILLRQARGLQAYAPIDISTSALTSATQRLGVRFPRLNVRPLAADFSRPIELPPDLATRPKLGFFPGSTIGNFPLPEATKLLAAMRETLLPDARLVIGVDLRKDPRRLLAAYNDAKGVTAAFNLNLLARVNRELDGNFDLDSFRHEAIYDVDLGRVEMRLVSLRSQTVRIADRRYSFHAGEAIQTEYAYKYDSDDFQRVARSAGWTPLRQWTDKDKLFSVHELGAD